MKRVLFVDDERLPVEPYIKMIEENGIEVVRYFDVDAALDFARQKDNRIDGAVLDCLMPPGRAFAGRPVEGGVLSGFFLYEALRPIYPDVPILVLTHINNSAVWTRFPANDLLLSLHHKFNSPPSKFAETLSKQLTMIVRRCHIVCIEGECCVVAFRDPCLGWVETDAQASRLPALAREGDAIDAQVWSKADGHVDEIRFADSVFTRPSENSSAGITPLPHSFRDRAAMEDYLRRLSGRVG